MSDASTPQTTRTRPRAPVADAPSHADPVVFDDRELTSGIFVAVRVRPLTLPVSAPTSRATAAHDEDGITSTPSTASVAEANDAARLSTEMSSRCVKLYPGHVVECEMAPRHTGGDGSLEESRATSRPVFAMSCHAVFDERSTQPEVMAVVGRRAVERVLQGYHGTILCYGQSGSGKTYTLLGPHGGMLSEGAVTATECGSESAMNATSPLARWHIGDDVGLLIRALHALYTELPRHAPPDTAASWQVTISAVELYNEKLRDLLPVGQRRRQCAASREVAEEKSMARDDPTASPDPPSPRLRRTRSFRTAASRSTTRDAAALRKTNSLGNLHPVTGVSGDDVAVVGLQKHPAPSFEIALRLVRQTLYYRTVHATLLNQNSNRAHTLFFVEVTQRGVHGHTRRAVLTLVDLAGSERVSQTGVDGVRLHEARKINLSLLCLGNVIRRITARPSASAAQRVRVPGPTLDLSATTTSAPSVKESKPRERHIPYRDSKLTQLLRNSFGGNAITFVLCTVSAARADAPETLSTLQFATMVRQVRNSATINSVVAASLTPAMAAQLLHELRAAHHELARLKRELQAKDAALALVTRSREVNHDGVAVAVSTDPPTAAPPPTRRIKRRAVTQLSVRALSMPAQAPHPPSPRPAPPCESIHMSPALRVPERGVGDVNDPQVERVVVAAKNKAAPKKKRVVERPALTATLTSHTRRQHAPGKDASGGTRSRWDRLMSNIKEVLGKKRDVK